jgi:hypothetical protein
MYPISAQLIYMPADISWNGGCISFTLLILPAIASLFQSSGLSIHFLVREFPQFCIGLGVFNRHAYDVATFINIDVNNFAHLSCLEDSFVREFDMGRIGISKVFYAHF